MFLKTQEQIMQNWIAMEVPLVSIRCITYNQERYIAQALDGFLMQETNFPFEIIVHDDASSDRTSQIIKEYEKNYPKIVKPIYETENQYSKKDNTLDRIILPYLKGKYTAYCEGDDYWTDPLKLQKQVNVDWSVNPDIIAGLVFVVGDSIIDTSLKSKLQMIGRNIIK